MRQRLGLAAALLRQPRLLVLDEPTNGLDPQGIHEIRDLLLALNAAGTTVFLSSHLLAEVEQLCTRVGVLDRGRLVLQDELAVLRGADRAGRADHARSRDAARALLDGRVDAVRRRAAGGARRRPGRRSTPGWSPAGVPVDGAGRGTAHPRGGRARGQPAGLGPGGRAS